MREFGNKCEIVGIDRLGLIWEIVSLLAWEMNNRELKLKEVDEDNKKVPKIDAILYHEGTEPYRLHPRDKIEWDIGRELLRGTLYNKKKWKTC